MDRGAAVDRLQRFHAAQGAMYAGGPVAELRRLLTEDVVWHVPGDNAIAGVYEGVDAVLAYFARRRDLASACSGSILARCSSARAIGSPC